MAGQTASATPRTLHRPERSFWSVGIGRVLAIATPVGIVIMLVAVFFSPEAKLLRQQPTQPQQVVSLVEATQPPPIRKLDTRQTLDTLTVAMMEPVPFTVDGETAQVKLEVYVRQLNIVKIKGTVAWHQRSTFSQEVVTMMDFEVEGEERVVEIKEVAPLLQSSGMTPIPENKKLFEGFQALWQKISREPRIAKFLKEARDPNSLLSRRFFPTPFEP